MSESGSAALFPEKAPATAAARIAVIGCGNSLAGDDSAGVEIVLRLEAHPIAGCRFLLLAQPDVSLMDFFDAADILLFIDGVMSGAAPGTLHLATLPCPALESRALHALSTHGWSLLETLGLARALGKRIPRIVLLGVEIADVTPGHGRSEAVEHAIEISSKRFPALHARLLGTNDTSWSPPRSFPPGDSTFPG